MTAAERKSASTALPAVLLGLLLLALGGVAAAAEAAPPTSLGDAAGEVAAETAPDPGVKKAMENDVTISLDEASPEKGRPKAPGKLDPGQKEMTLEEIKDLPVIKRLDIPFEKGEALLGDVKDETFGYGESAFYWLVDKVANMPVEAFKPSGDALPYSALLSLPSGYRGQPVTIRGVYMTVTPFRTPILALRRNVPVLYECIIREHPIEQQRPIATVVVIDDPMTYLKAEDHVVVKGYFYKVRAYKGTMGESICPMLVARRLEPEEGHRGTLSLAYLMGALVLVMGVAFLWIRQRTKAKANAADPRPVHRFRLRRPDRFEPPAVTGPGGEGGQPKP